MFLLRKLFQFNLSSLWVISLLSPAILEMFFCIHSRTTQKGHSLSLILNTWFYARWHDFLHVLWICGSLKVWKQFLLFFLIKINELFLLFFEIFFWGPLLSEAPVVCDKPLQVIPLFDGAQSLFSATVLLCYTVNSRRGYVFKPRSLLFCAVSTAHSISPYSTYK